MTINSTSAGALIAYNVEEGDTVEVGQGLFTIDTAASGTVSATPAAAAEAPAATVCTDVLLLDSPCPNA